ncbi:GGDEF domain-containing protein [Pseudodesulfovibrio tunisiensis]|uniref:GGDEF domain-containing protein n=1 Tax=Pseudodesulfovibrio tunisiensis TaxID=463192 RepID=UPI001FB39EEB|nr:GGDEF domain-containing protein [Pseudodesulfovibrio tunisiensis]
MPKESRNSLFSESGIARELANLQTELCNLSEECGAIGNGDNAIWVFRLFQGVSPDDWVDLAKKHDFSGWLTLPIDGNAYPHLRQFQEILERLAYQTEHDPLTGLANRRAFDRTLEIEIERTKRTNAPLSLAILDLDDFKHINDTYGHPKGDEVLKQFAECLDSTTRAYDLAARIGGEEFTLLLAGAGTVKAKQMLNRVRNQLGSIRFDSPQGAFNVTCSIGLTCYKGAVDLSTAEFIELADQALYEAKRAGKNRLEVSRLPFVDMVPKETLVHADEKQFLFGSK